MTTIPTELDTLRARVKELEQRNTELTSALRRCAEALNIIRNLCDEGWAREQSAEAIALATPLLTERKESK